MSRSHVSVALLVALSATACGGGSRASSGATPRGSYTAQVQSYLNRLAGNARNQGFRRNAAGPVYGRLNDDASSSHQMTVAGGTEYVLFGACDNDCADVDLKIFDTAGSLQMQDVAVDDTPVLVFTARGSGRYRIDVVMATCNRNPCYYGIQLMAR